jgi:hypothetical protein
MFVSRSHERRTAHHNDTHPKQRHDAQTMTLKQCMVTPDTTHATDTMHSSGPQRTPMFRNAAILILPYQAGTRSRALESIILKTRTRGL